METRKIGKHNTNYGQNNHNVKTYRVKKKDEPIVTSIEATNLERSKE
jgi:hypothetical protein